MKYFFIFIGSGVGGLIRYIFSKWIYSFSGGNFPTGTLVVNLSGCFVIGLLFGIFERIIISPSMRLFIFVGFLGGFTTFSTFGIETFNLLKSAETKLALYNLLITNVAGIMLVFMGNFLSKLVIRN